MVSSVIVCVCCEPCSNLAPDKRRPLFALIVRTETRLDGVLERRSGHSAAPEPPKPLTPPEGRFGAPFALNQI